MLRSWVTHHEGKRYLIKEDLPDVGFYLFVYDKSGKCTHDYLQDTLEVAKYHALSEFGVPIATWSTLPNKDHLSTKT